jgi:hypothetical protein
MVAEFESDLIRLRTREGMKVAKAKGRLRGKQPKQPKFKPNQAKHLLQLHDSGNYARLNSPNSSVSGDRRSTALLKGCGPTPSNLSGDSHTLWRSSRTPKSAGCRNLSHRTNAKVSRYDRRPNPSKKPQPQSGSSASVPASRKAAIHACQVSWPRLNRRRSEYMTC